MYLEHADHVIEALPVGKATAVEGTCSCGMWHAGPIEDFEEAWMFHVRDDIEAKAAAAAVRMRERAAAELRQQEESDAERRAEIGEAAVAWEEPPPDRRGWDGKWRAIREQLRAHPQVWARVADDASQGMVTAAKKALGQWHEVSGRNYRGDPGKKRCDVYARYVGPA